MGKIILIVSAVLSVAIAGCGNSKSVLIIGGADGPTSVYVSEKGDEPVYKEISQKEAKKIMDSGEEHIVLDVREQDEYDAGHIPGAILIPYTLIDEKAPELLKDKSAQILVYCRSGRRSKIAAEALAKLGYTNVKEFGGIIDWEYDIVNE